jgi:DNA repair protein RadA/Sms
LPKTDIKYVCQTCGYETTRWVGKCPECDAWNTLVEEPVFAKASSGKQIRQVIATSEPTPITEVTFKEEERVSTGIDELDRVLGGGVVHGSAVLVSGDPGIGKSTLMLQAASSLSRSGELLYVSGEESTKQISLRADRLNSKNKNLLVVAETNLFVIEQHIQKLNPKFVVIDSIQTIFREDLPSAPGSVSQVRECAAYLVRLAKTTGVPIFMIGHVTKEGSIAGPRILEHIVDTVLYFEGDRNKQFRILRATKNRFGSTNEIGVFEMKSNGLVEVPNPSEVFISERPKDASGSVITVIIEGTRPMLVEVQSLVSASSTSIPRRTANGVEYNRTLMLATVLEKRESLKLYDKDIYVNVAGGVWIEEPAADLAVLAAIASSYKNKPISDDHVIIGEVGLAGEVRAVNLIEQRLTEAAKLGFKNAVIPKGNYSEAKKIKGINILAVSNIQEATDLLLKQ